MHSVCRPSVSARGCAVVPIWVLLAAFLAPVDPAGAQEAAAAPTEEAAPTPAGNPVESFLRLPPWRRIGPNQRFETLDADRVYPYTVYGVPASGPAVAVPAASRQALPMPVGRDGGRLLSQPGDREVVFGSGPGGELVRLDVVTGERQVVSVWPDPGPGGAQAELPYRFRPAFPLLFSPHDDEILYAGGNQLFMTTDQGASWVAISPPVASGALLTAVLESPHAAGVFWVGAEDGTVALSQDFGETWEEVTPRRLQAGSTVLALEPHPKQGRSLYLLMDGPGPDLLRTDDFGATWRALGRSGTAPAGVRSLLADPDTPGLLYAGTDAGAAVSFDDGRRWYPLSPREASGPGGPLGPAGPVTALLLRGADLLAAGGDGGIWVLEGLSPAAELRGLESKGLHLFSPAPAHRTLTAGARGLFVHYYLSPETARSVSDDAPLSLEILEPDGRVLRRFSSSPAAGEGPLAADPGVHRTVWDLRYPGGPGFGPGPLAGPGTYLVRLSSGDTSMTAQALLRGDPRAPGVPEALEAQRDLLLELRDLARLHSQGRKAVLGEAAGEALARLEEARLGERLRTLAAAVALGQNRPTAQARAVRDRLVRELGAHLVELAPFLNPTFLTDRQAELAALFPAGDETPEAAEEAAGPAPEDPEAAELPAPLPSPDSNLP